MAVGDKSADEAGPHIAATEKGDLLILHNINIISMFTVQVGTDFKSVPGSESPSLAASGATVFSVRTAPYRS